MDQLSRNNYPDAQVFLGNFLYGAMKQPQEAFKFYHAAATNGSPMGAYMVAIFFKDGLHGKKDEASAFHIMNDLAEEKIDYAQLDLGHFYLRGIGCKQDLKKAAKYFKLAALQGNDVAQYDLSVCYQYFF